MENCLVILNYNDWERVEKLVMETVAYSSVNHILVVDNCSTDESFVNLQRLENEKIKIIRCDVNRGYATGNNYGAQYALNKWNIRTLFFANPDVWFPEEAIYAIEEALNSNQLYGAGTVLVKEGYNVWDLPAYLGTVRMLFLLLFSLHKRQIKKKLMQKKGISEVGVIEGSFFAIKADVFKKVSGFDERTFLYLEENILAHKLSRWGYKEVVNTEIYYVHEHSKSISKEYKSKANAFKLFLPSFNIYLKHYLNSGVIAIKIFRALYFAAYVERILFDVIKSVLNHVKRI